MKNSLKYEEFTSSNSKYKIEEFLQTLSCLDLPEKFCEIIHNHFLMIPYKIYVQADKYTDKDNKIKIKILYQIFIESFIPNPNLSLQESADFAMQICEKYKNKCFTKYIIQSYIDHIKDSRIKQTFELMLQELNQPK